jgi:hypothetical protein
MAAGVNHQRSSARGDTVSFRRERRAQLEFVGYSHKSNGDIFVMANETEETPVPLIDNIGAPDVFADRVVGAFLTNGNVHMTFCSRRLDHTKTPGTFSDLVIGRLVMPFAATENMIEFLEDFVARMKAQAASVGDTSKRTLQ